MSKNTYRVAADGGRELIVISDDEDSVLSDSSDSTTSLRQDFSNVKSRPTPDPSRTRSNKDLSPILNRVNKRPKLQTNFSPTSRSRPRAISPDDGITANSANLYTRSNGVQDAKAVAKSTRQYSDEDSTFAKPIVCPDDSSDSASNSSIAIRAPKPRPPYLYDPDFKLRMYRGPGYEQFPVPLELNDEHKRICQEWDQKQILGSARRFSRHDRYHQRRFDNDLLSDSDEADESDRSVTISPVEQKCIQNIYDILPDIDYEFVKNRVHQKYETFHFGNEEVEILPNMDEIVAGILEEGDYPRSKAVAKPADSLFEAETGRTIEWNKNHTTHHHYVVDAVKLLAEHFGDVPTDFIHKVMTEKRSLWDTFLHINNIDMNYFDLPTKPYHRSKFPRTMVEKPYNRGHDLMADRRYYACLVNELQAAKQHAAREFLQQIQQQYDADNEKQNIENNRIEGGLLECQCCFDEEVPLNRSVTCTGSKAHFFCYVCVRGLADSQIGLMRYEMQCMDSSGCHAALDVGGIAKAVPGKAVERLAYNQQQAEVTAAKIEGLEQCPMCDFKAICDPIEIDIIFSCQNPDCLKVTCRKCQQQSHLPKSCEEAKKDQGLQARHKVEEARSQAMIRSCPKCSAKIVKESGCNKMRCTCGTVLCYVCKVELSDRSGGYEHFNKTGSNCPLYDTPGLDRHTQDANEAEDKAVAEVKALDPSVEESSLRIETRKEPKSILNSPPFRLARPLANNRRNRQNFGFRFGEEPRLADDRVNANARPEAIMPPRLFNPHGQNRRVPDPQPVANFGNTFINDQRLVEAQERDNNWRDLETAARIHDFRNDLTRRRQFQIRRRSQAEEDNQVRPSLFGMNQAHPVFEFNRPQPLVRQHDGDIVMTDAPIIVDNIRNRRPAIPWQSELRNGSVLMSNPPAAVQSQEIPLRGLLLPQQQKVARAQQPKLPVLPRPPVFPQPSVLATQQPVLSMAQQPALSGLLQPTVPTTQQTTLPTAQQPTIPRTYPPQLFHLAHNNNNNNTNLQNQNVSLHNNTNRRNVLTQGFDFQNRKGSVRTVNRGGVPWHMLE